MSNGMPEGVKTTLGWTIGTSSIALIIVILLILFGNLSGNSGISDSTSTLSIINETNTFINATGDTLNRVNSSTSSYVITAIWNATNSTGGGTEYTTSIALGNATVSALGVVTNASVANWANVSISYTLVYTYDSQNELNFESAIGNYSESSTNTMSQFPTIGTILGVGILLAILVTILVLAISKMMGVSNSSGYKDTSDKSNFA